MVWFHRHSARLLEGGQFSSSRGQYLFSVYTQAAQKSLYNTVNANISSLDLVAKFIYAFLRKTKAFRIYTGPYTVGAEGEPVYITYPNDTQHAWLNWMINDEGGEYLEGYVGEDGPTPGTFDVNENV